MVFFVTGGSRGIGRTIVLEAAAAGHDVAFTYVSKSAEAERVVEEAATLAPRSKVRCYQMEVRDSNCVEAVTDQVVDAFGEVNCAVNNAGINRPGLAMAMSDEDWHIVLETNLTGAFYVSRAMLPHFLAAGGGTFVHLSSIGAYGITGQLGYCASKAGLLGLSAGLAKEYGSKNITSNVLMLGLFETDMTREGLSSQNREFWLQYCPAKRFGDPKEIAHMCLYLASQHARFVTGQVLTLSGGLEHSP